MSAHSSGLLPPDELADLHIFVVPLESWLEKYRTAFNNIALESVSAGFVRVLPYISLYVLRDHIEEQLGPDVVPEDYVFLRSVGRCMAVVKENQERLLKAKDFLPPKAYSPEVFILPLTHDAVARPVADANTIIATHGITTAGMASTQPVHLGMIPAGYQQNPQLGSQMVNNGYLLPQSGQTDDTGVMDRGDYTDNRHQRNNRLNELQFGNEQPASDDSGSSDERKQRMNGRRQSEDDGSGGSSENERLAERSYQKKKVSKGSHNENEEKDQFEPSVSHNNEDYTIENPPSKTKKHKMQKRASSDSSGSNQSGPKTVKFIQPEVHHSLAVPGPGGQLISPPTPIPSGRVISSPMPVQQHPNLEPGSDAKSDNRKSDGQNEKGAVIEKDLVNDKQKKVEQKGGKKKRKGRSRSPLGDQVQAKAKEQSTEMEAVKEKDRLDKLAVHSEVSMGRSASPPSLSEVEERSKFSQFPSPAKGARRPAPLSDMYDLQHGQGTEQEFSESHHDYNSLGLEGNPNSNLQGAADGEIFESPFVNGHDNQGEFDGDEQSSRDNLQGQDGHLETTGKDDGKTGGAGTGGTDNTKHGKGGKGNPVKVKRTVKKTVKKTPPENLDEKFKIPKVSPPPLMKEPQRGDKELEKDTPSAKDRKHQEIEELKAGLRRAKNDRVDMEKERESKMRRAKMLQNQVLQKRNQAKNVWKKRFFDEKRKTAPLEEQVNRLRYEVDVQHKALMSYLESKEREGNKTQAGAEFKSPSEKTNQRMSLARLQHEVEELKSRIEELKMKLTAEMKKRDAAQKELKQIREDLMEQKINLTLTKSQKSLATLTNPENIAV